MLRSSHLARYYRLYRAVYIAATIYLAALGKLRDRRERARAREADRCTNCTILINVIASHKRHARKRLLDSRNISGQKQRRRRHEIEHVYVIGCHIDVSAMRDLARLSADSVSRIRQIVEIERNSRYFLANEILFNTQKYEN